MKSVDTNILVGLLTRDTPDQTARAEDFIAHGAWVSHLVLVETIWVLESVYRLDDNALAKAIEMLLEHAQLIIQDTNVVQLALKHFRQHSSVDFSDCLILETAKKAGHAPLGTFDQALAKVDGATAV